jgi:hypothetical protein
MLKNKNTQLSTRLYDKEKTSKVAHLESKIQWNLCGELQCSFKRKKILFLLTGGKFEVNVMK